MGNGAHKVVTASKPKMWFGNVKEDGHRLGGFRMCTRNGAWTQLKRALEQFIGNNGNYEGEEGYQIS